ncbi:MAG TPA: hypothetical protein VFM63_14695 [Pyrinomonadaceae bacterium]|nr:hypothetical protein [Pyrinomonadaceae bacterium]
MDQGGRSFLWAALDFMWRIENLELRPGTLDFTSSEQGWRKVTQLFAGEVKLINAVELVSWDLEDDTQFLICEACGMEHCKQRDWVRVRRSGSLVLVLPAFDYVWAEREEDRLEYSPPSYLTERGIAYINRSTYETLPQQNPEFPVFERIPHLNMREAALLFHWTTPAQVLGPPPEIRVNSEILAGASEGSAADHIDHLSTLLQTLYDDPSHALLRPLTEQDHVLSLYLDASEFIDWKAIVVDGDDYRLVVDSRFVIVKCVGAEAVGDS